MCPDHLDWTEKYRPKSLSDVVGNDAAVKALRQWAMTFGSGKRAVILYGSPGVGKTSAALALANDLGWDYIEMNASDQRNKSIVQQIAGSAAKAGTFEGVSGRRLIVLDEADNLSGNQDRGGESAILNVIKTTDQPIILIANDLYALSKPLRDATLTIPFRSILSTSIAKTLRRICAEEHIKCDPDALMKIAERTSDLRSAINDLQAAAQGKDAVTLADVATGERDVPETIFKVMDLIFRGKDMREALNATYDLDENPEDLIGWVDENLPREYVDDDLERGFEALSRADMYLGRVRRRMDYGMWRYAGFMEVCGVNRARRRRFGGYTKYSPPTYWKKLGWTKVGPDAARLHSREDRQSLPHLEEGGPFRVHAADTVPLQPGRPGRQACGPAQAGRGRDRFPAGREEDLEKGRGNLQKIPGPHRRRDRGGDRRLRPLRQVQRPVREGRAPEGADPGGRGRRKAACGEVREAGSEAKERPGARRGTAATRPRSRKPRHRPRRLRHWRRSHAAGAGQKEAAHII